MKFCRRLLAVPYWPVALYLGIIAWLGIGTGGVAPPTMVHILPAWLVIMWSLSLAVGGTIAPLGILIGRNRLESSGLAMLAYGSALYGIVLTAEAWPRGGTFALVGFAIVAMCLIRLRVLRKGRVARHVAALVAAEVAETED